MGFLKNRFLISCDQSRKCVTRSDARLMWPIEYFNHDPYDLWSKGQTRRF